MLWSRDLTNVISNQECAKVAVKGTHITFHSTMDVSCHDSDDVTSLQVEDTDGNHAIINGSAEKLPLDRNQLL